MQFKDLDQLYKYQENKNLMETIYSHLSSQQKSAIDYLRLSRLSLCKANKLYASFNHDELHTIFLNSGMKEKFAEVCLSLLETIFPAQTKLCFDDIEKIEVEKALVTFSEIEMLDAIIS